MAVSPADTDLVRRKELSAFLRSRRDRLGPESVGLPSYGRRRAPGLRREEVAQLAGVGVTWYTWLEQGRRINASGQVVGAIARALRLDQVETAHLFLLAGLSDPPLPPEGELELSAVDEILAALDPLPAHVVSARYDVLAWNRAQARLLGDFGTLPEERRNLLLLIFTVPAYRSLLRDFETEAGTGCVARFRQELAGHLEDPAWHELRDTLLEGSADFRRLWARYDVQSYAPKIKRFNHPAAGAVAVAATTLFLADQPGARLVIYTPADRASKEALHRIRELDPWIPWGSPPYGRGTTGR